MLNRFAVLVLLALAALACVTTVQSLSVQDSRLSPSSASKTVKHALQKRSQEHSRIGRKKTVRGVNLGGWFILELWMMPSFFTDDLVAKGVVDQYTYMKKVDSVTARKALTQHWESWITETDFQQISAAGLNTVRLPVPHWAFNGSSTTEPYLAYAEQPYISQALLWAKKYDLDVIIDMHTAPKSQNGFDNSGRAGPIRFASSNPTKNAARLYSALEKIVQLYVNDAQYGGVVKGIEILNEPACWALSKSYITEIHKAAYTAIRATVSKNALVLPTTIVHDCFIEPLSEWKSTYASSFWKNGSYALDTHRYHAWAPQVNLPTLDAHVQYACNLTTEFTPLQTNNFPIIVGEWAISLKACATKDCTYATMKESVNSQNNKTMNLFYRRFFEAQVTTFEASAGGWIYWNWKTESSAAWSYQAAIAQGWIPKDPTTRVFQQVNGCPTTQQTQSITFATTSS
ncbi:hypothetical protein CBS101457_003572 [Exobasidium rhododendri]|nr:hypothetical protein CBS101457_003572 [Exobasidium rhododendri]